MLHHPDHQGYAGPPEHQAGDCWRHGDPKALARVRTTECRSKLSQQRCVDAGANEKTEEYRLDCQLINIGQLIEKEAPATPDVSLHRVITASILPGLTTRIPIIIITHF